MVRAVYIWGQVSRKTSFQLPGGPELLAWFLTGVTAPVTRTPCPGVEPPSLPTLLPKPVATRLRGQRPPQLLTPKMATSKAISCTFGRPQRARQRPGSPTRAVLPSNAHTRQEADAPEATIVPKRKLRWVTVQGTRFGPRPLCPPPQSLHPAASEDCFRRMRESQ